jgi:hypothetical protein
MKKFVYILLVSVMLMLGFAKGYSQVNNNVNKVYIVFKTHLDVGFTDLSSVVTKRYVDEFIPKAIDVAEKLRADGSGQRYIWTTGAWLIWKYLHTASPKDVARLNEAIRRGDIAWSAAPYTVESESMSQDMLKTMLLLSQKLDKMYGKHTIAEKMTDVPGHTRSIITPLYDAGIRFLHIGVNGASALPDIPLCSRWRDTNGKELILMQQASYGAEDILPDGKTVVSVIFTWDNHGPHTYKEVKDIYADLYKRFPHAQIIPSTLSDVATVLMGMKDSFPVLTSEIGDTWIYGYGSAPIRMAKYRMMLSLYSRWLREKKLDMHSDAALNFALELGLISEHTWGLNIEFLRNWDKYDMDQFNAARSSAPFQRMEQSWKEIDNYLNSSLVYLPKNLQEEAKVEMDKIDHPHMVVIPLKNTVLAKMWNEKLLNGMLRMEGLSYQTFDSVDFERFKRDYIRPKCTWGQVEFGKPGLNKSSSISATVKANAIRQIVQQEKQGTRIITDLAFPIREGVDKRVYPEEMQVNTLLYKGGKKADVALTIYKKPAVRLPETYWLSFNADDISSIIAEKVGERVDLMDVVVRGNRQMHGIDRYVDLVTSKGTIRIWSKEAFLVNVGEARGLGYSENKPNIHGGIHFDLNNNLWDTNFSMWNEGSLTYHFTMELLSR